MIDRQKTVLVTGASRGIGAGLAEAFLKRAYNVVATARDFSQPNALSASPNLALVAGDIVDPNTAATVAETAISRFGRIDALVNNAGIYLSKRFTDYTFDDLRALVSVNIEGFFFLTQRAIRQMLDQNSGGSIVNITTTMVDHPFAGVPASVSMITKGGLQAVTRSLALEYAKDGIRVNAVAPGIVDTNMHQKDMLDALRRLQPMGQFSSVQNIVDAVLYLTEADQVTGEVLHVDGGAHVGQW